MKTLKKVYFHQLEKVKNILKVEEIYRMPGIIEEKEGENLNMNNFIFPGRRNWDWYFSNNNGNEGLEKIENIYFSKEPLEELLYEYIDYIEEVELFMYVKIGEKNNILLDPKDYFKNYLDPSSYSLKKLLNA